LLIAFLNGFLVAFYLVVITVGGGGGEKKYRVKGRSKAEIDSLFRRRRRDDLKR
jgi:hypothetical protein